MTPFYGFLRSRLTKGKLYGKYYYTHDEINWQTREAPVFDLIKGEIVSSEQHLAMVKEKALKRLRKKVNVNHKYI